MYKHQKTILATTIAVAATSILSFSSVAADEQELRQEILNLKHKVERLEKSRIPLVTEEDVQEEVQSSWFENIGFSGLVEVEASYFDSPDGSESDIAVSTVELGIDAQLNHWVNAHVLIFYEEDATDPPEIDEAIITIANLEVSPWLLAAGRMYVPFGNYGSNMISDPLTLEIGETRETAVQGGYFAGDFYTSAYLFNGDTNDGGNDHIDQFGFNLGLAHEASDEHFGYALGLSWINNLADSDTLQDVITDPDNMHKKVPGLSAHAFLDMGSFLLIGEYLSATESFDASDLQFSNGRAKPAAYNLEAAYLFEIMGRESMLGIAWQRTSEALELELPETRYLATFSVEIYKNTALSLEYAHDKDYSTSKGGGGNSSDAFILQLAAAF